MKSVKQHRAAIIVMNVFVALLCIAAIAGYFLAPLLSVRVKVDLSADDLKKMAGDVSFEGVEVAYPDPEPVDVELSFETLDFVLPLFSGDAMGETEALISEKADALAKELTPVIRVTVEQVAEETIKEVIEEYIPDVTEEEKETILEEADLTEAYIGQKADEALELLNSGSANISAIQDFAVETVEEVFSKLKGTGRPEFAELTFDAETEQEVRDIVKENLDAITDEFGDLSTDEIVDRVLEEIANGLEGGLDTASAPVVSLSARAGDTEEASEAEEKLESNISGYIRGYLVNESSTQIFFYFTIAAFVLTAISMLSWLYLLIKVFVKGFTMNPAVKLKAPILFLGWLPFLVFFIIPSIAFLAVNALGGIGALAGETLAFIAGVSFRSSGLVACAAAVLLILLFIPYGIIRRKLKLELASRITPQEEAAYIAANPALVPQEPVVMEHTVTDEPYRDGNEETPEAEDAPSEQTDESTPEDGGDAPAPYEGE